MAKFLAVALLLTASAIASMPAQAGPCDYPGQTASDGSRCGGRSAQTRPGGYNPYGY